MRKFDADLYSTAKEALKTFLAMFKTETLPIVWAWSERNSSATTNINWMAPEDYEEDVLYGTEAGLYIGAEVGSYFIYLPKTTNAYIAFLEAMINLHTNDKGVDEEIMPNEIKMEFDGKRTVKYRFVAYGEDVTDEEKMTAVKTIAEELIDMLWKSDKSEFYKGDNEPDVDHMYHIGDKIPSNFYYVGIKDEYDIYRVW